MAEENYSVPAFLLSAKLFRNFASGVFPPFLPTGDKVKSIAPTDSQPPSREGGFFLQCSLSWQGAPLRARRRLSAQRLD
jgi:hypothetical protein